MKSYQLDFLAAQFQRKAEAYAGAVLIAVHHPPFNYVAEGGAFGQKGLHGPSRTMLRQIDEVCAAADVYPHAFISGHAHNYQRYSRSVRMSGKMRKVPFIVCGAGGHQIRTIVESKDGKPAEEPRFGADVSYLDTRPAVEASGLVLEKYNDSSHGYPRIGVDAGNWRSPSISSVTKASRNRASTRSLSICRRATSSRAEAARVGGTSRGHAAARFLEVSAKPRHKRGHRMPQRTGCAGLGEVDVMHCSTSRSRSSATRRQRRQLLDTLADGGPSAAQFVEEMQVHPEFCARAEPMAEQSRQVDHAFCRV